MFVRSFFLLAWLVPLTGWSQLTLQGQVRNADDGKPLPFATVFLANTSRGVTANENGDFRLTDVPVGKYDLVASYVGFQPLKVTIQTNDPKFYRLGLVPDTRQLAEVTVRARRQRGPDWAHHLEFFQTYFLGRSENASQCRLLNPEVLSFDATAERFLARASEPLVIENRGLGYRLRFLLNDYTYDHAQHRVKYQGDAVFEPLSGTEQDTRRWAENRRKAYLGSAMHFMRALYQRRLLEEGFVIQVIREQRTRSGETRLLGLDGDTTVRLPALAGKYDAVFQTVRENRLLDTLRSTPTHPTVAFSGVRSVTYTREREPLDYQKTRALREHGFRIRPQTTLLRMTVPNVVIEPSGHFYDPQGITYEGYWGWELIAENLPLDYEP